MFSVCLQDKLKKSLVSHHKQKKTTDWRKNNYFIPVKKNKNKKNKRVPIDFFPKMKPSLIS